MVAASHTALDQTHSTVTQMLDLGGQPAPSVSFAEVMSTLNPLQYIPVVGTIYRAVTGDDVHPAFRVAASAALSMFFGGPAGLAATMISVAVEEVMHGGPTSSEAVHRSAMASLAYAHAGRAA